MMFYLKKWKLVTAVLLVSLFLASCSSGNTGNEDVGDSQNESEVSAENAEGGSDEKTAAAEDVILRIAMNTEPDNFNPYLSAASDTEAVMLNVFEGLIGINERGDIIPKIAESWTISEDRTVYEFLIRDDVYFHNGELLRVDDVVYSLKRLSGLDGEKGASGKFEDVTSVESNEENTVTVTIAEQDEAFLSKCMSAILPAGYDNHESLPIGTGPYKFKSYSPGQSLKLELNRDYYDTEYAGNIEEVEFVFMADENAKSLALRSGTLHMFDAAKEIIDQINEPGFTKYHNLSNLVQILALNNLVEPFDDMRVREALNYAVNREEITMFISNGESYPLYTTLTPADANWYNYETENVYSYNPEKAKELLAEAGYPNGFDMEITVASNYLINVNTTQVIVNQLEAVGINAVINQVEWGQWLEDVYTERNYQASVVGLSGKIDPHEVINRFHSDYIRNFYNYFNDEYDALVEAGIKEVDSAKRAEIYNQAQMMLTEESASIFIQDPGSDIICVENLKGYKSYPITFWDLSSLYFE